MYCVDLVAGLQLSCPLGSDEWKRILSISQIKLFDRLLIILKEKILFHEENFRLEKDDGYNRLVNR